MDPVRIGLALRALRRQRGWTQEEVAGRARVSQAVVSRAERGEAASLTLRSLTAVVEALGATASVRVLWHGEALDRLLDAAHAGLVDEVIRLLRAHGWEVVAEATFSHYGERGSVDVLAYHPGRRALLIVEVKSVVPDMQALLAGIDRKARLGPSLAAQRGWRPASVSRLLVLPDDRTARRRLERHAATMGVALPARTREVRRWITDPTCAIAGVLFLPASQSTTARHRVARSGGRGAARGTGRGAAAADR
jgi:transcriptional regulator with XRE-family HTH domain